MFDPDPLEKWDPVLNTNVLDPPHCSIATANYQRLAPVLGFAFMRSWHFRNAGPREPKSTGTRKKRNAKFAFL